MKESVSVWSHKSKRPWPPDVFGYYYYISAFDDWALLIMETTGSSSSVGKYLSMIFNDCWYIVWFGWVCSYSRSSKHPHSSKTIANLLSPCSFRWNSWPFFKQLSSPSRATASILTSCNFKTYPKALIIPLLTRISNYTGFAEAVQLLRAQTASFLTWRSSFWRTVMSLSTIPESRQAWTCSWEPAVMFERTQHDSFLIVLLLCWMISFRAAMRPASTASWV